MKIAFGYKAGSGKDTAADHLIRNFGGTKLSHAQPLYDILHFAQGTAGFALGKDRGFLQSTGDWARAKNPNVWTDHLWRRVEAIQSRYERAMGSYRRGDFPRGVAIPSPNVYVTDVRFRNEFDALKAQGFTMVKLIRPTSADDLDGIPSRFDVANQKSHSSETELDSEDVRWDFVIVNGGSLEEFYEKLDRAVLPPSSFRDEYFAAKAYFADAGDLSETYPYPGLKSRSHPDEN